MAKFKQLDVLTLQDEESTTTGLCLDASGEEVSNADMGSQPNNPNASKAECAAASAAHSVGGFFYEGLQTTNTTASLATSVDLEKISSFKSYLNPDDGAEDTTKTEVIMQSGAKYVIKESLAQFMEIMATSVG